MGSKQKSRDKNKCVICLFIIKNCLSKKLTLNHLFFCFNKMKPEKTIVIYSSQGAQARRYQPRQQYRPRSMLFCFLLLSSLKSLLTGNTRGRFRQDRRRILILSWARLCVIFFVFYPTAVFIFLIVVGENV